MLKSLKIYKKSLTHPHILRLFHYFDDQEYFYLIHELIDKNLNSLFLKRKKMLEKEAFIFFSQIILALDFLHKHNILHKRLEYESILLDSESNIKLSDFGLMVDFSNKNNLNHLSPETLKTHFFTPQNDIWSLGLILYRMIQGQKGIKNDEIKFASFVSDECVDLIKKMLKENPDERITLKEIFSHGWIHKFEEVFKMQLKNYIYNEGEICVKKFIPNISANKLERSSTFQQNKRNNLNRLYSRISFAEEGLSFKNASITIY